MRARVCADETEHLVAEIFHACNGCCPWAPVRGVWWRQLLYRWRMWQHRNDPTPATPRPDPRQFAGL
jgi:hypothetical protein